MPNFEYDGLITLSSSVKDLDTSIQWFKEMLGFEISFRVDEAGWAEVTSPVTGVRCRSVTPPARAPARSAFVTSLGPTIASSGRWIAPTTPSMSTSGHKRFTSSGPISKASTPRWRAIDAVRRSSTSRSDVVAREIAPGARKPVACPVSASSRR